MSDKGEIAISGHDSGNDGNFLTRRIRKFQSGLVEKREAQRVLSENEFAFKRMSNIAGKIIEFADSSAFREKQKTSRQTVGQLTWDTYHVYLPQTNDGLSYGITVDRKEGSNEVSGISVFVSPSEHENYTTGNSDGHFRIQIHPDHLNRVKKDKKKSTPSFVWWDSSISGDFYLGKETSQDIDEIGITDLSTSIHLRSVNFGGWPSISLVLRATTKDNAGNYIGPIGKINDLQVMGVSRAKHPVKDHIADSESDVINIGDDFDHINRPFIFDRGGARFQAAKTKGNGEDILAFRFSGVRQRLNPANRDKPFVGELEHKDVAVPLGLANGFKVIDLIEKALDQTIEACKKSTLQLKDKNL